MHGYARFHVQSALAATLWYAVATAIMTWPLLAGLARDVFWDMGDPLLNKWIIGWNADHLVRFLSGDIHALAGFWNAKIFYPEPLALAYSEHLLAQTLQILPVFALTRNLLLCYNLLILSTFVLSGLGAYLLVRELTGSARAGFVAGLIFAFAPYRIGQFSHIQELSSQWMPFALYGFRRFFETRRLAPLAGATAAWIAQNLSCGYYMMFFAPFLAAYVLYEIVERGLYRNARVLSAVACASLVVALVTWPFVQPYVALRALGHEPRPLGEINAFSADVYSYLTAHGEQRLWGSVLRMFPKPEGDLFPSVMPLLLAGFGVVSHARRVWQHTAHAPSPRRAVRWGEWIALGIVVFHIVAGIVILGGGGGTFRIGPVAIRIATLARVVRTAAVGIIALLIISPRWRAFIRGLPHSTVAFFTCALFLAFWLSLGPYVQTMGRQVIDGLYSAFYWYVPGFDGLRVPARYAMLVMLFLAVLAGFGAREIERRWRRGAVVVLVAGLIFLAESTAVPIVMNGHGDEEGLAPVPGRIWTGVNVPPVYRFLRELPADAVIAEFPFGAISYEIRYAYYSTEHWHRLVNGYSGGFPARYLANEAALRRVLTDPDQAWRTLSTSGATHVVVHEDAFLRDDGHAVSEWLSGHGARRVVAFGPDKVFELPKPAVF